jgi:hypothetical protein
MIPKDLIAAKGYFRSSSRYPAESQPVAFIFFPVVQDSFGEISPEIGSKMGYLEGLFAPLRGGPSSLRRTSPRISATEKSL